MCLCLFVCVSACGECDFCVSSDTNEIMLLQPAKICWRKTAQWSLVFYSSLLLLLLLLLLALLLSYIRSLAYSNGFNVKQSNSPANKQSAEALSGRNPHRQLDWAAVALSPLVACALALAL